MSISKTTTALKKNKPKEEESRTPEIIPWPDLDTFLESEDRAKEKISLKEKFLFYKGKKIPILQFQKAGYEKLLKLLVKEIER